MHNLVLESLTNLNPTKNDLVEKLAAGGIPIVTGQQLGIFGGPLLTLYKFLTAIKFAEEFNKKDNKEHVPVFWLQSEDHDVKELFELCFPNQRDTSADFDFSNRQSVGNLSNERFYPEIEKLFNYFNDPKINSFLKKSYRKGSDFETCFLEVLEEISKKYPILFYSPLQTKTVTTSLYLDAFTNYKQIANSLIDYGKQNDVKEIVHIRENSPLFFLHLNGERHRIIESGQDRFKTIDSNIELTKDQIKELISKNEVSSSALFRPILQEFLFPNCTYVGGKAEVGYFKQIPPLFEHFKLRTTPIVERAGFNLLDKKSTRTFEKEKISLSAESVDLDIEAVPPPVVEEQLKDLLSNFEKESELLIGGPLGRSKEQLERVIIGMNDRYKADYNSKTQTSNERILLLKSWLFPNGVPQERVVPWIYLIDLYGIELIDKIYSEIDLKSNAERKNITL